mmetsp:Transcript_14575/g.37803  ORF Transcript_14575/g.37803 Transcript_14575/m.37803 type:complete len:220 (-) Transcript_14575:513-1172(-)
MVALVPRHARFTCGREGLASAGARLRRCAAKSRYAVVALRGSESSKVPARTRRTRCASMASHVPFPDTRRHVRATLSSSLPSARSMHSIRSKTVSCSSAWLASPCLSASIFAALAKRVPSGAVAEDLEQAVLRTAARDGLATGQLPEAGLRVRVRGMCAVLLHQLSDALRLRHDSRTTRSLQHLSTEVEKCARLPHSKGCGTGARARHGLSCRHRLSCR